jgi:chemotaxis receptor (MCP) glutamine deamidase CheD
MIKRWIALSICFCLAFEQAGFAQVAVAPGIPAYLSGLAPVADKFRPVHLRSVGFGSSDGTVELLLDKGDAKDPAPGRLETTAQELFKYFKVGLRLPDRVFWVNLRPDSPDQVIDPLLEKTDVGRIMLEADLQLKKDLSRLTSPDTQDGRQYWNKLYEKAALIYGDQDVEIPTLTRPWIVPGEIIIRAGERSAFVYKAALKVMLEQDYLKDAPPLAISDPRQQELNSYSSRLIRELIIPKLTRAVNSSERYASLRQVYYSLVLAQWYKQKKTAPVAAQIDTRDLSGLTSRSAWSKDACYQAYRRSFQNGEYNRQEQANTASGVTIRQYFSGGIVITGQPDMRVTAFTGDGGFAGGNDPSFARLTVDSRTGDILTPQSSAAVAGAGFVQGEEVLRAQDLDQQWQILRNKIGTKGGTIGFVEKAALALALKLEGYTPYTGEDVLAFSPGSRGIPFIMLDPSGRKVMVKIEDFRNSIGEGFREKYFQSMLKVFKAWESPDVGILQPGPGNRYPVLPKLYSAGTVNIRFAGSEKPYLYQIMEAVDGKDLGGLLEREYFSDDKNAEAGSLVRSLGEFTKGIKQLHDNQLAHGELLYTGQPRNILYDGRRFRVIDLDTVDKAAPERISQESQIVISQVLKIISQARGLRNGGALEEFLEDWQGSRHYRAETLDEFSRALEALAGSLPAGQKDGGGSRSKITVDLFWNSFIYSAVPGRPSEDAALPDHLADFKKYLKDEFCSKKSGGLAESRRFETRKIFNLIKGSNVNISFVQMFLNMLIFPTPEKKRILYIIYSAQCSKNKPLTFSRIIKDPLARGIGTTVHRYIDLQILHYAGLITLAPHLNGATQLEIVGVNKNRFRALYPDIESYRSAAIAEQKTLADTVKDMFVAKARAKFVSADMLTRRGVEDILDDITRYDVMKALKAQDVSKSGMNAPKQKIRRMSTPELAELIGLDGADRLDGGAQGPKRGLGDAIMSILEGKGALDYIVPPFAAWVGFLFFTDPVLIAPIAMLGGFVAVLTVVKGVSDYRRILNNDPEFAQIFRGNPFAGLDGWEIMARGLDGIFDMPEVVRNPRKALTNITRILYDLPFGVLYVGLELAADCVNGLRTGTNLIGSKLDTARFAIKTSSGIHPAKILYLLFGKLSFAKDDAERAFMMYETIVLHAMGSSDLSAPKEDTERNNTFLASETAFYHLITQLKLENMDAVAGEQKRKNSILYKYSRISRDSITSWDVLHSYLSNRSRIWNERRNVIAQDRPLLDLLVRWHVLQGPEYVFKPYYSFAVLKILDQYFNGAFTPSQLLMQPHYAKILDMPLMTGFQLLSILEISGVVVRSGDDYSLSGRFKEDVRGMLAAHFSEVPASGLAAVPEYEGVLHVDGKLYRWQNNKDQVIRRDGGKLPVLEAEFFWNDGFTLPPAVKDRIQKAATWRERPDTGGGRAGIITLREPLTFETANGPVKIRAIKIKGMGDFNDAKNPRQPRPVYYAREFHAMPYVDGEGRLVLVDVDATPAGGLGFSRARNEFDKLNEVLARGGVSVNVPLGYGAYAGLEFRGDQMGFVIEGMADKEDNRFDEIVNDLKIKTVEKNNTQYVMLGGILQRYLKKRRGESLDPEELAAYVKASYGAWGASLRRLNDMGILHMRTHSNNWAVDRQGAAVVHDFDSAVHSADFQPRVAFMLRLYPELAGAIRDIHADVTHFPLIQLAIRAGANPYRAFLEAYFGKEQFAKEPALQELVQALSKLSSIVSTEDYPPIRFRVTQMAAFFMLEPLGRALGVTPPYSLREFMTELYRYHDMNVKFSAEKFGTRAADSAMKDGGAGEGAARMAVDREDALAVLEGKFVISPPGRFRYLKTYDVFDCIAVTFRDPKSGLAGMAHVAAYQDRAGSVKAILEQCADRGISIADLEFWLIGPGSPLRGKTGVQLKNDIRDALNKAGVRSVREDINGGDVRSILFDTVTGEHWDMSGINMRDYQTATELPFEDHLALHGKAAPLQELIPAPAGPVFDGGAAGGSYEIKNPPAALTFLIADIKNTPGGIKILELGNGVRSGFDGYDALHEKNMMSLYWEHLKTLNIPVWYAMEVQDALELVLSGNDLKRDMALDDFRSFPGNKMHSMDNFWKELKRGEFGKKSEHFDPRDISTYSGILIPNRLLTMKEKALLKEYRIITLDFDGAAIFIVRDKFLTKWLADVMYEDTKGELDIRGFFPKWKMFPKVYSPDIAQSVLEQMPAENYVIKPLDGTRGGGVIVTSGKELDTVLRIVLQSRAELSLKARNSAALSKGEAYAYWASDETPGFIVESLESSTPVAAGNEQYDATLRMVFSGALTKDQAEFTYLDGYWKLPEKPAGQGDLNARYISRIHPEENNHAVSAGLSAEDKTAAIAQLNRALPELYKKMLSMDINDVVDRLMRSNDQAYVGYGIYMTGGNERFTKDQMRRLFSLAQKKDALLDDFMGAMIGEIQNKKKIGQIIPLLKLLVSSPSLKAREAVLRQALDNRLSEVLALYGGAPQGIISAELLKDYTKYVRRSAPHVSDGGSPEQAGRIVVRDGAVQVLSLPAEHTGGKTLAKVYSVLLDRRLNPGGRILWFGSAMPGVPHFTREQCVEMAKNLAEAPQAVKDKLWVDPGYSLADILEKYYVVIGDTLVVISPSGEILTARIDVQKQIRQFVFKKNAPNQALPTQNRDLLNRKFNMIMVNDALSRGKAGLLDGGLAIPEGTLVARAEELLVARPDIVPRTIQKLYGRELPPDTHYKVGYLASGAYKNAFKVTVFPDDSGPLEFVLKTMDEAGRAELTRGYDERDSGGRNFFVTPENAAYAAGQAIQERVDTTDISTEELLSPIRPAELDQEGLFAATSGMVKAYFLSMGLTRWPGGQKTTLFPVDVAFKNVGFARSAAPMVKVLDIDLARRYTPLQILEACSFALAGVKNKGAAAAIVKGIKESMDDSSASAFFTKAAEEMMELIDEGAAEFRKENIGIRRTESGYYKFTNYSHLDYEIYDELLKFGQLPSYSGGTGARDGGSEGAGNAVPVADIGFLNHRKIVAVFSPASPRRITLATFIRREFAPPGDNESGILFVKPAEVSSLTREQSGQIVERFVEKLAEASADADDMRAKLGIEGKYTLKQILADNYLVIGDNLVVMGPGGEILTGTIDFYDQIRYWFSNKNKWDTGPMYRSITEKRSEGAEKISLETFMEGLPRLKAKLLAENAAKKEDLSARDGGAQDKKLAGIDFRALPAAVQPAQVPAFMPELRELAAGSHMNDLDAEWRAIEKQMQTADMPYDKIKEYIAVCANSPAAKKRLEQVSSCLINILRMEEEQAVPTRAELKALLVCLG